MTAYSSVLSFTAGPKLARMTQSRPSLLWAPYHTLRAFNYLMQDAGIMLGRHLKEAPPFICRDGSSARREKGGLPEYHEACWCSLQRRTYLCLFLSLAFSFFYFLAAFLQLALHVYVPLCRGMLVLRRSGATGRIDRSTWGETTALTSHFTTCCSQVYTLGTCCTVPYLCASVTLNMVEPGEKGSVKNSARTWKVSVGCSGLRIECFFKKVKIHSECWLKTVVEIVQLQRQCR